MVKVKVEQGWLEGKQLVGVTGAQYCSFKGVPYAAPPLGKLRFKAPKPPLPWDGVRKALEHGPMCCQQDIFTNTIIPGNEDCLYLNVYTPEVAPKTPLPVMVFIHGGGYKSGSGNDEHYGPDFLMNHGVVLVTINYRLEVLGFLCLDTEDVPGNAGMKDQVAALKWINKNIAQFGGDPSNVTVFGESAGGASTALHVLSPMSKGLFKRAIPMSGTPLCDFSVAFEPRRRAFVLGKQLGCETDDPKELLEFLQSVPTDKLINTDPSIIYSEVIANNIFKMYHFTPVIEKDFGNERFLPEDPLEMLKKGKVNEVDVMIGYTSQEALLGGELIESLMTNYNRYPEVFVPRKILISRSPKEILEAADLIHEYYFNKKPMSVDVMEKTITYLSESCFVYDVAKYLKLLPKNGKRKYMYQFSCVSKRNIYGSRGAKYGLTGASHLDDLMYLFHSIHAAAAHPIDNSSKEYKMIQMVCTLFTNFAKYGNPTPDNSLGATWPEYEPSSEAYLDIAETLTPGHHLRAKSVEFWHTVYQTAGMDY